MNEWSLTAEVSLAKQSKADAALIRSVAALEEMVQAGVPHADQAGVMAEVQECAERGNVSKAVLDEMIRRLATFAAPLDLVSATFPLFGCGLCIENGGDAEPAVAVTLRFTKECVHYAARNHQATKALNEGEEVEIPDEEWVAGNMYEFLSPVLCNVLERSPSARQAILADKDFLRDIDAFEDAGECPEGWVPQLVRQAD